MAILASDDSLVDVFETVVDTSGFAEAGFKSYDAPNLKDLSETQTDECPVSIR